MQSSRVVVAWHMKQKKQETHSQLTTLRVGTVASLLSILKYTPLNWQAKNTACVKHMLNPKRNAFQEASHSGRRHEIFRLSPYMRFTLQPLNSKQQQLPYGEEEKDQGNCCKRIATGSIDSYCQQLYPQSLTSIIYMPVLTHPTSALLHLPEHETTKMHCRNVTWE